MKNAILAGVLAVASIALLAAGYMAGRPNAGAHDSPPRAANAGTPEDRMEIEAIVRDYLLANPDLLVEMQSTLETRQEEERQVAQQATISESAEAIFDSEHDAVLGNPDGDITIVEFFDYNCGFCKRALDDMEALIEAEPELRFVLKEFPILSEDSQAAHVVSMAFRALAPDRYGEFHRRLLGAESRAGEARAVELAVSLGVDEDDLRREMQNPAIMEAFRHTYELADELAVTGTPAYVVGGEVVFGAQGRDVLAEKIDAAR